MITHVLLLYLISPFSYTGFVLYVTKQMVHVVHIWSYGFTLEV